MIKIQQLCDQLTEMIGEETLHRELEGILRKHQGIALRTRKSGRVDRCLTLILDQGVKGNDLTPRLIAGIVMSHNLGSASLYRLVQALRKQGVQIRGVDILHELKRIKAGVY
jgi:hypothetical protein